MFNKELLNFEYELSYPPVPHTNIAKKCYSDDVIIIFSSAFLDKMMSQLVLSKNVFKCDIFFAFSLCMYVH